MKRAVREHWAAVVTIVTFGLLATVLGVYTLQQQRLQSPFASRYTVKVSFAQTPGIAPGLGQPATVAGVKVGQISGVELHDGRALVTLTLERGELPRVFRDASASLRPNTALQDLQVDLRPGTRAAGVLPAGGTIGPVGTRVPVGADQLLGALNADTRQYLTALLAAGGAGLDGRGVQLRRLLEAIGPTATQVRALGDALTTRRAKLARTVHALSALAVAAGGKDGELRRVVRSGGATLAAIAGEDRALRTSLRLLPGTLAATRRTLASTAGFADAARPALARLQPVLGGAPAALRAVDRLSATATPALRTAIRPAVRAADRALPPLPAATRHLTAVTPDLENSFKVLEYLTNELFYSDGGRAKGYPFWLAWAQHNGNATLSTGDAHGQVVRSALIFGCSTINALPELTHVVSGLAVLVPAACPVDRGAR